MNLLSAEVLIPIGFVFAAAALLLASYAMLVHSATPLVWESDADSDDECPLVAPERAHLRRRDARRRRAISFGPSLSKRSDANIPETCVVCHDRRLQVISLPCNHIVMCRWCGEELLQRNDRCPWCRAPLDDVRQVAVHGLH